MKKYDVFFLYVVRRENNLFICTKMLDGETYKEIFTGEKLKNIHNNDVEPLWHYYSLLTIINYKTKEHLMLSKKDLLLKYASLNSSHIEIDKHKNQYERILTRQQENLEGLKKLQEVEPELAKEYAKKSLQGAGILDEDGELKEPYNKVFTKNNN